jgi:uncharacterized integral membrane protein
MSEDEAAPRRNPAKLIAALVLVLLLVIFWAENRTRVRIKFLGYSNNAQIWVALAASAVVGVLIGALLAHRSRN